MFRAFEIAAQRNNAYAIGEVIQRLEEGIGVKKNKKQALKWREKLPQDWKDSSISDLFAHLLEIKYTYSDTGILPFVTKKVNA